MNYYKGISQEEGIYIEEEHALGYALDRVLTKPAETEEFLEWYYSSNWIKIKVGDEEF